MWLEQDMVVSASQAPTALAPSSDSFASPTPALDPSVVQMLAILQLLYQSQQTGRATRAFAVLCKRLQLRMSTLQRLMTTLEAQALVSVTVDPPSVRHPQLGPRYLASLTPAGVAIAERLSAL